MWRVFLVIFRLSIMTNMTSPLVAVLKFGSVFLDMIIYVAFAGIIYSYAPHIGGFSRDQLFIITGTSMFIEWLSWFSFRAGSTHVPEHIRSGKIESALVKPMPSQFLALFTRMDIEDSTRLVTGLILVIPHAAAIAAPTALHIFLYIIALFGSLAIYFSLLSSISSLAFFFGKLDGMWAVISNLNDVARYPHTIFSRKIQWIFFSILPIAFLGSVPTLILTSNNHWFWLSLTLGWAVVSVWLSTHMWRWASSHYSGASG